MAWASRYDHDRHTVFLGMEHGFAEAVLEGLIDSAAIFVEDPLHTNDASVSRAPRCPVALTCRRTAPNDVFLWALPRGGRDLFRRRANDSIS